MKQLLFYLLIGLFISSCGINDSKQNNETVEELQILQIVSEPLGYENQIVKFEGTIGHICRHSGDKMRVVQKDDNAYSIMVMLGDYSGSFNQNFEGMDVIATGVVKTSVRNIDQLSDHDHGDGDDHDGGHNCASTEEAIARLKERGIDADVVVFVELTGFEIQ